MYDIDGTTLRKLRNDKLWTQEELAMRAGLTRNYVQAIERERVRPGMYAIRSLARALRCPVEDIVVLRPVRQPRKAHNGKATTRKR